MAVTDQDYDEFQRFATEFSTESDRAAVILGAAKLDVLLFQILQKVLRPSTGKSDDLLEGDSPLATFSSRAMMVHRLGLIDDEFYRAINLVRRIRNSFAHELSGVTLESGSHRDRIRELVSPMKSNKSFQWLESQIYKQNKGPGLEFRGAVALMALRLEGIFNDAPTITLGRPWSLLPDDPPPTEPPPPIDS